MNTNTNIIAQFIRAFRKCYVNTGGGERDRETEREREREREIERERTCWQCVLHDIQQSAAVAGG